MTDTTLIAIVSATLAALPPTLVALAGLRQGKANAAKADEIVKKTEEIHVLADGNLTRINTELQVARKEIDGLKKLVQALTLQKGATGATGATGSNAADLLQALPIPLPVVVVEEPPK